MYTEIVCRALWCSEHAGVTLHGLGIEQLPLLILAHYVAACHAAFVLDLPATCDHRQQREPMPGT